MSLATAIEDTMRARGLTTVEVARRLGEGQDRATFYRMLNGATREPRLGTLVQLCLALEICPSELLDLARLWSPDTPGQATPADLRLRGAFARVRALPVARNSARLPWSRRSRGPPWQMGRMRTQTPTIVGTPGTVGARGAVMALGTRGETTPTLPTTDHRARVGRTRRGRRAGNIASAAGLRHPQHGDGTAGDGDGIALNVIAAPSSAAPYRRALDACSACRR